MMMEKLVMVMMMVMIMIMVTVLVMIFTCRPSPTQWKEESPQLGGLQWPYRLKR